MSLKHLLIVIKLSMSIVMCAVLWRSLGTTFVCCEDDWLVSCNRVAASSPMPAVEFDIMTERAISAAGHG